MSSANKENLSGLVQRAKKIKRKQNSEAKAFSTFNEINMNSSQE